MRSCCCFSWRSSVDPSHSCKHSTGILVLDTLFTRCEEKQQQKSANFDEISWNTVCAGFFDEKHWRKMRRVCSRRQALVFQEQAFYRRVTRRAPDDSKRHSTCEEDRYSAAEGRICRESRGEESERRTVWLEKRTCVGRERKENEYESRKRVMRRHESHSCVCRVFDTQSHHRWFCNGS